MRFPLIVTTAFVTAICAAPFAGSTIAHASTASPPYGATWTVDTAANSLTEYAPSASGSAAAIASVHGASTGLSGPSGVAIGSGGNMWVANAGNNSITEYAAGANGDQAPIATISGGVTALDAPSSITIDGALIWVTDPATNVAEAFSAGSSGNEPPAESLSGPKTRLNHPISISVDNEIGLVSVLNMPSAGTPSITTYFGVGNVAPAARVSGASGHALSSPTAIVAADFGVVWVAERATNSLTEIFTLGASPALRTIKGAGTGLDGPNGLSIDARGQVVVANGGDHTVRVFATTARGDVAPLRTIDGVGSDTGNPAAVAVFGARPGAPTVVTAVAHNGSATVHWHAPANTGGGIVGYDVSAIRRTSDGEEGSGGFSVSFGGVGTTTTATSDTVHHLKNGKKYFFEVQAVNSFGFSASGRSNAVTPLTVPGAPDNVIAAGGNHSIAVGWTKPAQNGGDKIRHYRVEYATCSPGAFGCAFHSRVVGRVHRQVTVRGLRAATKYHVRVIAESAFGSGHASKIASATTIS